MRVIKRSNPHIESNEDMIGDSFSNEKKKHLLSPGDRSSAAEKLISLESEGVASFSKKLHFKSNQEQSISDDDDDDDDNNQQVEHDDEIQRESSEEAFHVRPEQGTKGENKAKSASSSKKAHFSPNTLSNIANGARKSILFKDQRASLSARKLSISSGLLLQQQQQNPQKALETYKQTIQLFSSNVLLFSLFRLLILETLMVWALILMHISIPRKSTRKIAGNSVWSITWTY